MRLRSLTTSPSLTGLPRHEVLEPRGDGDLAAAGVRVADAGGGGGDLADPREQRARRGGEAVDEAGGRVPVARHREPANLAPAPPPGARGAPPPPAPRP